MFQHKKVIHPKPNFLLACLANDWPLVQYRTSATHQPKGCFLHWKMTSFHSRFNEVRLKGKIKTGRQQYVDCLHSTYTYVFPSICLRHLFRIFFSRFQRFLTFSVVEKKGYMWNFSTGKFLFLLVRQICYILQTLYWPLKAIFDILWKTTTIHAAIYVFGHQKMDRFQDSSWYLRCRTQDFHL